jgi:hypothetical protein
LERVRIVSLEDRALQPGTARPLTLKERDSLLGIIGAAKEAVR